MQAANLHNDNDLRDSARLTYVAIKRGELSKNSTATSGVSAGWLHNTGGAGLSPVSDSSTVRRCKILQSQRPTVQDFLAQIRLAASRFNRIGSFR
jgi:hypothetical protein